MTLILRRWITVKIKKLQIEDNLFAEVTSSRIFKNNQVVDRKGNFLFDDCGIFSTDIFPRIDNRYSDELPYGYINFPTLDIPMWSLTNKDKVFRDILHYNGFIYDGEYHKFDVSEDLTKYDTSKVLIGYEACIALFGTPLEEYEKNIQHKIYVSHPYNRPIIKDRYGKHTLSKINQAYINIIRLKKRFDTYFEANIKDIWYELTIKKRVIENLFDIYEEIIRMIQTGKKSNIQLELKGHPIDGMCRAVITNNFDLPEDVVMIGSYFIEYLYPYLYSKHTKRGITDVQAVNKELRDNEYYCLLNRMPTIGAGSTLGMIPQFSDLDKDKYVFQLNPIVFASLQADVDGDSLSVVALYSKDACAEAKELLASRNYLTNIDGSIINCIFEDLMYSLERSIENGETNELRKIINNV